MRRHSGWNATIMSLSLTVALLGGLQWRLSVIRPAPPPSASPGLGAIRDQAFQLRKQGEFEDAVRLLRGAYDRTHDRAVARDLLGVLEDAGRIDELLATARAYVADYPKDPFGRWMLARGLLFQGAVDPARKDADVAEAARLAARLAAHHYRNSIEPGAVATLQMQIAILRHRWGQAARCARRALTLGSTPGESADIIAVEADEALRAGHLPQCYALARKVRAVVRGWKQPVYYQLFPYREILMMGRLAYRDRLWTRREVHAVAADERRLEALGLHQRLATSPVTKLALAAMHGEMRDLIALRKRGDTPGELRLVQIGLAGFSLPHKPICFYADAVYGPLVRAGFELHAGDLCRKLHRWSEARRYYEDALREHPDDRVLEGRLRALRREEAAGATSAGSASQP